MRRNLDLIRAILLEVEKANSISDSFQLYIDGHSIQEIHYHVKLLNQAGYLEAEGPFDRETIDVWNPICLTWQGHEFLDAARDNTIWNKTKITIGEKLPSVSFDILKSLLNLTVRQQFGIEL